MKKRTMAKAAAAVGAALFLTLTGHVSAGAEELTLEPIVSEDVAISLPTAPKVVEEGFGPVMRQTNLYELFSCKHFPNRPWCPA